MDTDAIDIQISEHPHDRLVSLVEATVFGSGDLQYRRLGVKAQLERFSKPAFFHAIDAEGKLVGVYILDERDLSVAGRLVKGYYRGVLAVDESHQGQGIGRLLVVKARQWAAENRGVAKKNTVSASEISENGDSNHAASVNTFNKNTAQIIASNDECHEVLSFGCIDKSNRRSLALLQSSGAYVAATLTKHTMYRQFPSVCCSLTRLKKKHVIDSNNLDAELYADCLVKDITRDCLAPLALIDGQGIAISARVFPSAFNIIQMGPAASLVTQWFVKPFPTANKRFNPENFTYVSFSDILIRQGCERLWSRFVSTVLSEHNCHIGIAYVDPSSQLFVRLQKTSVLSRFMRPGQGSINVVLQTHDLDAVNDAKLRRNAMPVKLYPIDV